MPFAPVAGRDEAQRLYIKGLRPVDIANQLCLKADTVRQWVARGRWARMRSAVDDLAQWSGPQLGNAVAERFVARVYGQADRILSAIEALKTPVTPRDVKDVTTALASVACTGRKALGLDDGPTGNLVLHFHGGGQVERKAIDVTPQPAALPDSAPPDSQDHNP